MLDASGSTNGHGLLHGIESVMSSLFLPSLRSLQSGWGHLETPDGLRSRTDFLNTLDTFVSVIVGQSSFHIAVILFVQYVRMKLALALVFESSLFFLLSLLALLSQPPIPFPLCLLSVSTPPILQTSLYTILSHSLHHPCLLFPSTLQASTFLANASFSHLFHTSCPH